MGWYQRRLHGDSHQASQRINMLKIALVVCFAAYAAAEAKAEADAALLYGGYGYGGLGYGGHGYGGLGYAGLGYGGLGYSTLGYGGLGYSTLGYGGLGYYGKRSADAEPEAKADAGLLYGG